MGVANASAGTGMKSVSFGVMLDILRPLSGAAGTVVAASEEGSVTPHAYPRAALSALLEGNIRPPSGVSEASRSVLPGHVVSRYARTRAPGSGALSELVSSA